MSSPIITLTSDFGPADGYVAAMKGAVLGLRPDAILVDVAHELPAQDIAHAAFVLGSASPYFPPETVHVAVVDPGVGTVRHPLLLNTPRGTYLAPHNGLLTYVLLAHGLRPGMAVQGDREDDDFLKPVEVAVPEGCRAYVLNRGEYWLRPVSDTFHGRDIFAPSAAHFSLGVPPEKLGYPIATLVGLNVPEPIQDGNAIRGRVVYVDRFGNLVSNIRPPDVAGDIAGVEIEGERISGLSRSYAEAEGLLAIIGSHGYLEVAVTEGSAARHLNAEVGTRLTVVVG